MMKQASQCQALIVVVLTLLLAGCLGASSSEETSSGGYSDSLESINFEAAGDGLGAIYPEDRDEILEGRTATWQLVPDMFSQIDSVSGCGGDRDGYLYEITGDGSSCTVSVEFSQVIEHLQQYDFGTLNDDGVRGCTQRGDGKEFKECPSEWYIGESGEKGREAAHRKGVLDKEGGGKGAFDFTKMDDQGQPLSVQDGEWSDEGYAENGNRWECVKDNHTELTWEVKQPEQSGYRSYDNLVGWHDPDNAHPQLTGGSAGEDCDGIDCTTHAYIEQLNDDNHCGFSDWRLPHRIEMISIMDRTIDADDFMAIALESDYFPLPATREEFSMKMFWTQTPAHRSGDKPVVWAARFGGDNEQSRSVIVGSDSRSRRHSILAVRGEAAFTPKQSSEISGTSHCSTNRITSHTPDSRYLIGDDPATVEDQWTGLEWQRCPHGSTFVNGQCSGDPDLTLLWGEALRANADYEYGWRAPNMVEMLSLVEPCRDAPAINTTMFPSVDATHRYWTSTRESVSKGTWDAIAIGQDNGQAFNVRPNSRPFIEIDNEYVFMRLPVRMVKEAN